MARINRNRPRAKRPIRRTEKTRTQEPRQAGLGCVSTYGFHPDLGTHFAAVRRPQPLRHKGCVSFELFGRQDTALWSTTGGCVFEDTSYCVTFDFPLDSWVAFADSLCQLLWLDLSGLKEGHHLRVDPRLPLRIDFSVVPSQSTSSESSDEEFVPLLVSQVHSIKLFPTREAISARHGWWLDYSSRLVTSLPASADIQEQIQVAGMPVDELHLDDFARNLVTCFLITETISGTPPKIALGLMGRNEWITTLNEDKLLKILAHLSAGTGTPGEMPRGLADLLVWYVAIRMYQGTKPDTVQAELLDAWSMRPESVSVLLNEARYCLARGDSFAFRQDHLESEILQIKRGNKGIARVIEERLSAWPSGAWSHPELSAVVEPYVCYDVLRQVHKAGRDDLVAHHVLKRCEENVALICEWLKMFGAAELKLFCPTTGDPSSS